MNSHSADRESSTGDGRQSDRRTARREAFAFRPRDRPVALTVTGAQPRSSLRPAAVGRRVTVRQPRPFIRTFRGRVSRNDFRSKLDPVARIVTTRPRADFTLTLITDGAARLIFSRGFAGAAQAAVDVTASPAEMARTINTMRRKASSRSVQHVSLEPEGLSPVG